MKIIALAVLLVPAAAVAGPASDYGFSIETSVAEAVASSKKTAAEQKVSFQRFPGRDFKRCTYQRIVKRECVYSCEDGSEYRAPLGSGSISCAQLIWVRK